MPTDKVLFQCREELLSVGIQLHRLFQQIVQVDTLSGAYEECRAELNAVPELLQHILELLQAHIVNVDCHSKELMSVLLCVCLAIKGQGRDKSEAVSYDLIEHIQTVIIETIRERKITVKLSDADCDRLARKCGEHGLTIGELIENFVGDLVGGTYSNGSDERDYADQWFERCWFGMFPEPTLLNHLLNLGYEPEHYLDMLENVETIKSDIEITKQNIAEPSDEWKDIVYHKYNDDRTSYECMC